MEKYVEQKRKIFIDIAKGFLIILVVLGHSGFWADKYIYWFHMPAFFMVSGYLMKTEKNIADYRIWVKRTFIKLAVPYAVFYLLNISIVYLMNQPSILGVIKDLVKFIYGGRVISGVFWFITCLFLSELIFKYIVLRFNKRTVFFTVCILYILAHIESALFIGTDPSLLPLYTKVPWNLDVSFMAIPYLAIGYYLKNYLDIVMNDVKFRISVLFLVIMSIVVNVLKVIDYSLDLKYVQYTNFVLDLVIPILFTLLIIIVSKIIEKYSLSKFISFIGKNTLIIMYLHIPLNLLFSYWFKYNFIIYLLIGTIIPITFNYFVRKWEVTRFLFLGDQNLLKKNLA